MSGASGRGRPVRRWQSCEDRIRFDQDVSRNTRLSGEDRGGEAMALVPRREAGYDDTGVNRDHRRVRSIVARTTSSVSAGRRPCGTATAARKALTSFAEADGTR